MASKGVKAKKYLQLLLVGLMIAGSVYFANNMLNKQQQFEIGASGGRAEVFFEPTNLSMSTQSSVNLWTTTDRPLSYASFEISFDPQMARLVKDLEITNPSLTRIVKNTPFAEANNTGKIVLVVANNPSKTDVGPVGTFRIGTLSLIPKTTLKNQSMSLGVNATNLELVDNTVQIFVTTVTPISILINPEVITTPAPTVVPITTPQPTPAATPAPTGLPDGSIVTPVGDLTLYPVADSRVQNNHATNNYGSDKYVSADGFAIEMGYFTFNLGELSGKQIKSALLRLRVVNTARPSSTQLFKFVPDSTWSESKITYNNRPISTDLLATINGGKSGEWVTVDLTQSVRNNAGRIFSFDVESSHADGMDFATRESLYKPELVVSFN